MPIQFKPPPLPAKRNSKRLTPALRRLQRGQGYCGPEPTARAVASFYSRKGFPLVTKRVGEKKIQVWLLP